MLDDYCRLHGWDEFTGFPKREILENLELRNIANGLEKIGKFGT